MERFQWHLDTNSGGATPGSNDLTGRSTVLAQALASPCLAPVKRRCRQLFLRKKCTRVTWLEDFLTSKLPGSFTALAQPLDTNFIMSVGVAGKVFSDQRSKVTARTKCTFAAEAHISMVWRASSLTCCRIVSRWNEEFRMSWSVSALSASVMISRSRHPAVTSRLRPVSLTRSVVYTALVLAIDIAYIPSFPN